MFFMLWIKRRALCPRGIIFILLLLGLVDCPLFAQQPPPNLVTYYTNPSPTATTIPQADGTTEIVLHKELYGYPNYGVADGRSDILYTGEVATWDYALPSTVDPTMIQRAFFRAALIADDHYGVDLGLYRLTTWTNASYLGEAVAGFPHGTPFGSRFTNWVQRDFPVATPVEPFSITLFNTSGIGNWFAVDWIELHLIIGPTTPTTLSVSAISPNRGGTVGNVTALVQGSLFPDGPVSVSLSSAGKPAITGQYPEVVDDSKIVAAFDLRGADPGLRDVLVTFSNGVTARLNGGFEVINGGGSELSTAIIGPSVARVGRQTAFLGTVTNTGLNDSGLLSITPQIGDTLTGAAKTSALVSSFAAGNITGGLWPGGINTTPFEGAFSRCTPVHFKVDPQPDECADLAAAIASLKAFVASTTSRIRTVEIQIEDLNAQIANCTTNCDALRRQLAALKNFLASLRSMLADTLRRLKALQLEYKEKCGGEPDPSIVLARQVKSVQAATASTAGQTDVTICPVFSWDPNDKSGPAGIGSAKYVSTRSGISWPYTVFFENESAATAPAQEVFISDQLDPNLDWATLSLGTIRFGSTIVQLPDNVSTYTTTVDLRPSKNLLVRIEAAIDIGSGLLTWHFTSLDPDTGQIPTDPLAGFLPPNKNPPEGEGSVQYTISPKTGIPTGTTVSNQAEIIFDNNPPLNTPVWVNTVDNTAPASSVFPLPEQQDSTIVPVQWTASDAESGVKGTSVYVSDNGGPFQLWQSGTTGTQATFTGMAGHIYSFYSKAEDMAGNVEQDKGRADALVRIGQQSCALDAIAFLKLSRSGFRWDNATGRFLQTITLTNTSSNDVSLPISIVFDTLSLNTSVFNQSGTTICTVPWQSPYINLGQLGTQLGPGQSLTGTVEFTNQTNSGITYDVRILVGSGAR